MYSILHISDLHRSHDEPVDNDALIAALMSDCDRYMGETPMVPAPDAIIVSGDVIQGARLGEAEYEGVLRRQYEVAGEFLDHLARRFLAGDRSRLVIVPGNHDVCWNTSYNAMSKIAEEQYPSNIAWALDEPESTYRWSWNERALYQISDQVRYARRLDAYWEFIQQFYAGVELAMPIDRERGFQLFELDGRRIVVAAFDSIHGNDCFSYSGSLARGAVGRCALALRDLRHSHEVRIGVWHHSVQGPPRHTDYLDISQVHELVGHGFQLGLHGHQHVAAAATHYVHLVESQAMAVVSAGSLCAGSRELPRGVNRQYNIIVIEDDYESARVHVREMVEGGHFTRKSGGGFLQGYASLSWRRPVDASGRTVDVDSENERRAILAAEDALHSNDPGRALSLLENLNLRPGTYPRSLAIRAAQQAENWSRLVSIIGTPQSPDEAVLLISAHISLGSLERAEEVLRSTEIVDPATRRELRNRIDVIRMMRGR